jgi:subtilisin family serine protease
MGQKEKHIILRGSRPPTGDVFLGPMGGASGLETVATGLSVEVADMDNKELAAVTRAADVVAVAPAIPMKLIEPVDMPGLAAPAAAQITWGVKAVGADTSPFTGNGIVVAVLDTGIDSSHPAFAGVSLIEKDFTGEGNGDQHGHGTHCAGTIFGRDTNGTRIGVARGVTTALIGKVLGSQGGASDEIVNAIQWAVTNGAHVISMSLGIDFPGLVDRLVNQGMPPALATSRALEGYRANVQLFERLASLVRVQGLFTQPTVIVAAAGNESERSQDANFEIAVSPPAVAEGVVSVAALADDPTGFTIAPFSNTGANVSGPGVGIISAKRGGGLVAMNGTSMACPHVAGVAALWAEKVRGTGPFTAAHILHRLVASGVTENLKAGFDPFDIGTGLVRAPQS